MKKKVSVLNVCFDDMSRKEIFLTLMNRVEKEEKTFVVTANPEIVMKANEEEKYMEILKSADYITADGIGIVKGAKILGTPITERVAGYDLMLELLKGADCNNKSVYLLGAKQDTIEKTVQKLKREFPNIHLVGYHNGYFDLANESIMNVVLGAKPDFLFVGLGFYRQEKWIQRYLEHADKGLAMGVGGAFDAYTGVVKRAPAIFIKLNLEWFYRLMKQPSRFKRMLVLPKFLLAVRKEKKGKIK